MDQRAHENRTVALGYAVSKRLPLDTQQSPEEIVQAAEKYFDFLQGDEGE